MSENRLTKAVHRVYCAGPLFNQAERDEMAAVADVVCEAGFSVYLPHRDGMEFRHVHHALVDQGWPAPTAAHFLHAAIFALDIFQLVEECGAVVWNLNGRTPDEGAVSEAAIAWTLGKPLVAYKEDVRSLITGRDNPLLVGLVEFETLNEIGRIPEALEAAIRRQPCPAVELARLPAGVRLAVEQGRELWNAVQGQAALGANAAIAEVVARLFGPAAGTERDSTASRAISIEGPADES